MRCPKCGKTLFKKKGRNAGLYCLTEGCGFEKGPEEKESKEAKTGKAAQETQGTKTEDKQE